MKWSHLYAAGDGCSERQGSGSVHFLKITVRLSADQLALSIPSQLLSMPDRHSMGATPCFAPIRQAAC